MSAWDKIIKALDEEGVDHSILAHGGQVVITLHSSEEIEVVQK